MKPEEVTKISKRLISLVIGLIILCLTLSVAVAFLWVNNQELRYQVLRDFSIAKGSYKLQLKEIRDIKKFSKQATVPTGLIYGMGKHEKGFGTMSFGVKKVTVSYIDKIFLSFKYWQLFTCIDIVKQEMYKYCEFTNKFFRNDTEMLEYIETNKKGFTMFLAKRYCPNHQKDWAYWVLKYWKEYNKEAEK